MSSKDTPLLLTDCPAGAQYVVTSCHGGENYRKRLHNIGIGKGKTITKIHSHPFRGPVTVRVQNAVIAVGHSMAQRIEVKPIPDETSHPDR